MPLIKKMTPKKGSYRVTTRLTKEVVDQHRMEEVMLVGAFNNWGHPGEGETLEDFLRQWALKPLRTGEFSRTFSFPAGADYRCRFKIRTRGGTWAEAHWENIDSLPAEDYVQNGEGTWDFLIRCPLAE